MNAMWKSFMTSIGLLAIALVAALYSSNAAGDGRGIAAGISAVVALVDERSELFRVWLRGWNRGDAD